jgi:hypothetical protein
MSAAKAPIPASRAPISAIDKITVDLVFLPWLAMYKRAGMPTWRPEKEGDANAI